MTVWIVGGRYLLKQIVRFLPMESEKWKIAGIISKGGKSTGKYRDWLKIKNREDNSESNIDWKAGVKEWHVAESKEDVGNQKDNLKDLSINGNEEGILFSGDTCSNKEQLEKPKFAELENWEKI